MHAHTLISKKQKFICPCKILFLNCSGTLKTVPKLFICCVQEQMFLKCSRTCMSTNEEHFKNFKMSGNVLKNARTNTEQFQNFQLEQTCS